MPSEIVVEAQCTTGVFVVILHRETCRPTGNPLVILSFGLLHGAWVRGIPVGQVDVCGQCPILVHVIPQLDMSSILLEPHVRAVVVSPDVLSRNGG